MLICGVSCPYETRFLTATIAAFRYRLIVQHPFPWTRAAKASFLVFGKAGHLMQICVEFLVAASVTATPCNNSSSYRRANIRTVTIDETVIFSQTQFLSPSALVISTGNFYFFFFSLDRRTRSFFCVCGSPMGRYIGLIILYKTDVWFAMELPYACLGANFTRLLLALW